MTNDEKLKLAIEALAERIVALKKERAETGSDSGSDSSSGSSSNQGGGVEISPTQAVENGEQTAIRQGGLITYCGEVSIICEPIPTDEITGEYIRRPLSSGWNSDGKYEVQFPTALNKVLFMQTVVSFESEIKKDYNPVRSKIEVAPDGRSAIIYAATDYTEVAIETRVMYQVMGLA